MMRWGTLALLVALGCKAQPPVASRDWYPVQFRRTMCFGPCAAFTATFAADGSATLRLVHPGPTPLTALKAGVYTGTFELPEAAWWAFVERDLAYFSLDGVYDNPMVMDLPATETTLAGHRVYNRMGGPDLTPLYERLDSLVYSVTWAPAN
jgi:hypothetical protein